MRQVGAEDGHYTVHRPYRQLQRKVSVLTFPFTATETRFRDEREIFTNSV